MGERIGAWRIVALAFSMLFYLVCSFLISAPASAATGDLVDTVTYVSVMQKNASITVQPFYEGETFPTVKDSPCSEDPKGYNKEWCSTHKFLGWSLAAGSKNVNYKAGQTVDAALLGNTVYAVWRILFFIWSGMTAMVRVLRLLPQFAVATKAVRSRLIQVKVCIEKAMFSLGGIPSLTVLEKASVGIRK